MCQILPLMTRMIETLVARDVVVDLTLLVQVVLISVMIMVGNTAGRIIQLDPGSQLARLVVATEAIKQRRYEAALRTQDIRIPGVEEVLGQLAREYPMAIVTTSRSGMTV